MYIKYLLNTYRKTLVCISICIPAFAHNILYDERDPAARSIAISALSPSLLICHRCVEGVRQFNILVGTSYYDDKHETLDRLCPRHTAPGVLSYCVLTLPHQLLKTCFSTAFQTTAKRAPCRQLTNNLVCSPRPSRPGTPSFAMISFVTSMYDIGVFEVCLAVFITLNELEAVSETPDAATPNAALRKSPRSIASSGACGRDWSRALYVRNQG
mmetsp:Transcript_25730/g.61968  ORF Transcript_25730/g.61968 Transcript_25730/m.61968 type:complete len:213 (+) Transcript_25730:79-717(+)